MSTNDKATKTETLLGGAELIVTLRDNKSVEPVFIRQLAIELYPKLLSVQDDECKLIELYCGKEAGFAVTLSLESHEKIIDEGERINSDFFLRWVKRRIARQERLIPGVTQKVAERALAASQSSSQKPVVPAEV